jgi:hypothetical protein
MEVASLCALVFYVAGSRLTTKTLIEQVEQAL